MTALVSGTGYTPNCTDDQLRHIVSRSQLMRWHSMTPFLKHPFREDVRLYFSNGGSEIGYASREHSEDWLIKFF
jgi:hypothetical protein